MSFCRACSCSSLPAPLCAALCSAVKNYNSAPQKQETELLISLRVCRAVPGRMLPEVNVTQFRREGEMHRTGLPRATLHCTREGPREGPHEVCLGRRGERQGELSPWRRPSSDRGSGAGMGYVPDSLERQVWEGWKAGWVELSKHPNSYN